MLKMLFGIIIGVALMLVFLYLGGGRWLKEFGRSTEKAGARLEVYEKRVQDTANDAGKTAGDTIDKTREKVGNIVK